MRLTANQVQVIRDTAQRMFSASARVSVFGSMALNDRTGGDIDLFFETDNLLVNRAKTICRLYGALLQALGDRKFDVVLKDANAPPASVFEIAKRTGMLL